MHRWRIEKRASTNQNTGRSIGMKASRRCGVRCRLWESSRRVAALHSCSASERLRPVSSRFQPGMGMVVPVSGGRARSNARRGAVPGWRAKGSGRAVTNETTGASKLVGCTDTMLRIAMAVPAALVVTLTRPRAKRSSTDADESAGTRARPAATIVTTGRPIAGRHAWLRKRRQHRPAESTPRGPRIVWQHCRRRDRHPAQSQHAPEHLPPAASRR
jgi:hypothetical protein